MSVSTTNSKDWQNLVRLIRQTNEIELLLIERLETIWTLLLDQQKEQQNQPQFFWHDQIKELLPNRTKLLMHPLLNFLSQQQQFLHNNPLPPQSNENLHLKYSDRQQLLMPISLQRVNSDALPIRFSPPPRAPASVPAQIVQNIPQFGQPAAINVTNIKATPPLVYFSPPRETYQKNDGRSPIHTLFQANQSTDIAPIRNYSPMQYIVVSPQHQSSFSPMQQRHAPIPKQINLVEKVASQRKQQVVENKERASDKWKARFTKFDSMLQELVEPIHKALNKDPLLRQNNKSNMDTKIEQKRGVNRSPNRIFDTPPKQTLDTMLRSNKFLTPPNNSQPLKSASPQPSITLVRQKRVLTPEQSLQQLQLPNSPEKQIQTIASFQPNFYRTNSNTHLPSITMTVPSTASISTVNQTLTPQSSVGTFMTLVNQLPPAKYAYQQQQYQNIMATQFEKDYTINSQSFISYAEGAGNLFQGINSQNASLPSFGMREVGRKEQEIEPEEHLSTDQSELYKQLQNVENELINLRELRNASLTQANSENKAISQSSRQSSNAKQQGVMDAEQEYRKAADVEQSLSQQSPDDIENSRIAKDLQSTQHQDKMELQEDTQNEQRELLRQTFMLSANIVDDSFQHQNE